MADEEDTGDEGDRRRLPLANAGRYRRKPWYRSANTGGPDEDADVYYKCWNQ
jgi:hypothetical protein